MNDDYIAMKMLIRFKEIRKAQPGKILVDVEAMLGLLAVVRKYDSKPPNTKMHMDSIDLGNGYWCCGNCHTEHAKQYDSDQCCSPPNQEAADVCACEQPDIEEEADTNHHYCWNCEKPVVAQH